MLNDKRNNEARETILNEIRRNLAASAPFDAVHREHHAHKNEQANTETPLVTEAELQEVSLIERFRENLISIGGNCTIVENLENAVREISAIIAKTNAQKIAVTDSDLAVKAVDFLDSNQKILKNAAAAELFDCDLGISGAQWAIAETGTLVLESEKEFNRLASLVPPIHICLVETKKLRRTLGEVLESLNANGRENLSRTITFITGPSRTSDIELTLAIGVHGPGELFVILIDEK